MPQLSVSELVRFGVHQKPEGLSMAGLVPILLVLVQVIDVVFGRRVSRYAKLPGVETLRSYLGQPAPVC